MTEETPDLVDYDGFAKIAGLTTSSLRTYATAARVSGDFPEPVSESATGSKKLWRRQDAEAWQARRAERAKSQSRGRPAKGEGMSPPRIRLTPEQTAAVQARLDAADISTVETAALAGISRGALFYRTSGKSGWKKSELQAIAKRLGVGYRELTSPADAHVLRLEAERARLQARLAEIDAEVPPRT